MANILKYWKWLLLGAVVSFFMFIGTLIYFIKRKERERERENELFRRNAISDINKIQKKDFDSEEFYREQQSLSGSNSPLTYRVSRVDKYEPSHGEQELKALGYVKDDEGNYVDPEEQEQSARVRNLVNRPR